MDAVIKLSAGEFDENFFNQVKALISRSDNLEITISISDTNKGILREETAKEYVQRVLAAKKELDKNSSPATFKADQFDEFEKFLLNEP